MTHYMIAAGGRAMAFDVLPRTIVLDIPSISNPQRWAEPEPLPAPEPEDLPPHQPQPDYPWSHGHKARPWIIGAAAVFSACLIAFLAFYIRFARLTDDTLRKGVFAHTIDIYAAPATLAVGGQMSLAEAEHWLHDRGYSASPRGQSGWFAVKPSAIVFHPGAASPAQSAEISFTAGRIARIVVGGKPQHDYQFGPRLITNLSDRNREKRRIVKFQQIPPALVNAVVSVEDKHFFSHGGFDLFRMLKAAYVDVKTGRKQEGASTLSMQLARAIWLQPEKRWQRKFAEVMIAMHLEHKLSKQQILADYCNQVYMGRQGTFNVNGFGEAARAYFGKDISQLTVPEAALLAGLVQRPSYYNPFRYPDRALERRNLVLRLMRENGKLSDGEYAAAVAAPLRLSPGDLDGGGSQYFLDMVNDEMQNRLGDNESQGSAVYTTLDEDLQRAAVEAVRIGMQNVDAQLRRRKSKVLVPPGEPQVALIALDPHTGEIKALVGGRDYGASQLNHIDAERQPGSSFKPFVYAAALNTAVEGGSNVYTPAAVLLDEPTTFFYDHQQYQPGNFEQNFMGAVTLRQALAHSLNVATVKLAQAVGYSAVVDMARRAGLNDNIRPTPAVALGSYVCTPLEIAAAYTVFANGGTYVKPTMLAAVRTQDDRAIYQYAIQSHPALDPRVNYLMVNLLEEVMRSGTAAGARSRGFTVPAAGKTGTSRDGWFAGFTSRLLCVVWVGFDDNRELGLEGARSALPIWTEFMKRALKYPDYSDVTGFRPPNGVSSVRVCADSRQLAGPNCLNTYSDYFIDGTQPPPCAMHSAPPQDDPNVNGEVVSQ